MEKISKINKIRSSEKESSRPSSIKQKSVNDEDKKSDKNKLIAIIRIAGMVKVSKDIANTLHRLRLRRKYVCVVVKPTKDILGMLKKVKYYVAYGEIDKETHGRLVQVRRRKNADGKLKPFFRLHPPRKGIKSKLQYPKGVLGNNKKDINKLIERML